ncbi:MFS transporter [Helicobacter ailurogastricus]|uniref:MFS transporter n=1 Tax=Helicobacter ailurogastricus TaxID=1578720 RepID=UPI000CF058DC|nr:MFS transporter [Helicobacter ailurogastricus]
MRHYLRIVFILALSSFCLAVSEFLVSGVLTRLSLFYGVSDSQVGNLVTLHALGVVVGAPTINVLISSLNYRNQLALTLSLFALSNVLMFFSHSFLGALIARFIGGLMHGVILVIATIICFKFAPKAKKSMALSLVSIGFTTAMMVGVPLGILVSRHFGLLMPFLLVACLAFLAALLTLFTMPKFSSEPAKFKSLSVSFGSAPVWQGFFVAALSWGSVFVVHVYLRVLLERYHFSPENIANIYLCHGIAATLGVLFGGKLADLRGLFAALSFLLTMQILALGAMSFSYHLSKMFLIASVIAYSFFGYACIAPIKMLGGHLARLFTPTTMSSTIVLHEVSLFKGIALGSFVGGLSVHYLGVHFNGICAALLALCALLILTFGIKKSVFAKNSKVAPSHH